jgi:3-methyladenine DNA glycosylase AlkD
MQREVARMKKILELLQENKDETYAVFMRKLLPTLDPERIIGVRTPALRKLAKQLACEDCCTAFMQECPHTYFEENQLHGFLLSGRKDFAQCIKELEQFLPYIDNWATCDQTSPRIFKKHRQELLPYITKWLSSDHPYTVRFAIGMLMQHFLNEDFNPVYLDMVTSIKSEEYYVNMEIAWYMATALAKQWESTIPYIEQRRMEPWVHNRTIQKARESYRITEEQKEYLKKFKEDLTNERKNSGIPDKN